MANLVLINPYIHDFAAYNLWSAPLGSYKVAELLSEYDCNINILDCLDAPIKKKEDGRSHIKSEKIEKPSVYKNIPRYFYRFGIPIEEFKKRIRALLPVDVFLVSSSLSYWYPGVIETIKILKEVSPKTPVILGGIYATLYHDHARRISGADMVYKGAVSESLIDEVKKSGVILKKTGVKKHWSEYVQLENYAPLLTSYGCPMKCTYCASHILNPKFVQREPSKVVSEIELLYSKGVRNFAFYDDALLVNSANHFIPIMKQLLTPSPLAGEGRGEGDISFFTPVGIQSRLITKDVAEAMKLANFKYIRIGYETGNVARQKETGGKVNDLDLEFGIKNLFDAGFKGKDIGVFIMYGLPDQPLSEVEAAIDHVKRFGVRIALTEFSPIPGTIESTKLKLDLSDPLVTNNTAYSLLFCDYDKDELEDLKLKTKDL